MGRRARADRAIPTRVGRPGLHGRLTSRSGARPVPVRPGIARGRASRAERSAAIDCSHIRERMDMQGSMDMQTDSSLIALSPDPPNGPCRVHSLLGEHRAGGGPADAPRRRRRRCAVLSLNGEWRFRLSPTAAGTGEAFVADDFDDSGWDTMRVPSHWVLEDFTPLAGGPARRCAAPPRGRSTRTPRTRSRSTPPRVPTENPTGDYRLVFDVPGRLGRGGAALPGRRLVREGVAQRRRARLVDGQPAAVRVRRAGARRAQRARRPRAPLVGGHVPRGPGHVVASRHLPRRRADRAPRGAIDDHFVHADFDAETGLGTLRVDAATDGGRRDARARHPDAGGRDRARPGRAVERRARPGCTAARCARPARPWSCRSGSGASRSSTASSRSTGGR